MHHVRLQFSTTFEDVEIHVQNMMHASTLRTSFLWLEYEHPSKGKARRYFLLPSTRDLLHPCSADLKRKYTHINVDKKNTRFKLGVLRHSWQLGWSLPARVQQKHSAGLEGRNPSEEVFGHTALFFVSVKWFKEFLLVSCRLLSSHLTGRWKRLEKKVAIQKITSFRFPKTLDQHQQLHFTISHSFRDVRPKANLQKHTKVAGCDINNGVPQQTVTPALVSWEASGPLGTP